MDNKLILADNYPVFRIGMARILAVEDSIRIVAQCETFPSLYKAVERFTDAIVILSASLLPQPDALTQILRTSNSRGIVVIENAETPQNYLKQDMRGVVYRKIEGNDLVTCVLRVSKGELYVQKSTESDNLHESNALGERVRECLTPKELLILSFVIRGYKNKLIAAELKTSEQVVKNYLSSIFTKTGTFDRLELALFTVRNAILAEAATAASGCNHLTIYSQAVAHLQS